MSRARWTGRALTVLLVILAAVLLVRSLAPWEVLPDDGAERYEVRAP